VPLEFGLRAIHAPGHEAQSLERGVSIPVWRDLDRPWRKFRFVLGARDQSRALFVRRSRQARNRTHRVARIHERNVACAPACPAWNLLRLDLVLFTLPTVKGGRDWVRLLDTNLPDEDAAPDAPTRFRFGHKYGVTGRFYSSRRGKRDAFHTRLRNRAPAHKLP
jgi:hypothetical protein